VTNSNDEFGDWAGAFVLGALEPGERRAFEDHLDGCANCAEEVRSLLTLHGVLSQLDRTDVVAEPDPSIADSIVASARTEQHDLRTSRRRWRVVALVSAATLLPLITAIGFVIVDGDDGNDASDAPTWTEGPNVAAAITATEADDTAIYTSSRGWGTEIRVELLGLPQRPQYQLWVVDSNGTWTQSSTWGPTPSGGAAVTGATSVPVDAVERIVVTSQDREEILIDATV
jgi:anti-sigma-K factor RskA